jgi:UDP-N-acetylglucosamine 2-epimerase (non-hydrolysing)
MALSTFVITDSGGVQEEAPALGKPVLVLRETTERPEGVTAGTVRLVGTEETEIVKQVSELLNNDLLLRRMTQTASPYGDGKAAQRIVAAIQSYWGLDPIRLGSLWQELPLSDSELIH